MKVPKHQILTFECSGTETYTLKNSRFKGFVSVIIEKPYSLKMQEMGAKYILTGYDKNGNQTIFTGLFPINHRLYKGDHFTPERSKTRHLIIVQPTSTGFRMFYFNTYPKTSTRRLLTLLK